MCAVDRLCKFRLLLSASFRKNAIKLNEYRNRRVLIGYIVKLCSHSLGHANSHRRWNLKSHLNIFAHLRTNCLRIPKHAPFQIATASAAASASHRKEVA